MDAHLDNVVFVDVDARPTAILFDWQGVSRGRGAVDLATFITCASIEQRRAGELKLLRQYHLALQSGGVAEYPFEQLTADYRLALLRWWIGTVNGYGSPQSALLTGRQADLGWQGIERMCAAALDHDLPALL